MYDYPFYSPPKVRYWSIVLLFLNGHCTPPSATTSPIPVETPTNYTKPNLQNLPDFTYAAKVAIPAVVEVKAHKKAAMVQRSSDHPLEELEKQLKKLFGEEVHIEPKIYEKPAEEHGGSGVIYTDNGYIVTNYHVIEGADSISVILNEHSFYEARVIVTDPATDLAVLKIEANHLPYLTLGNSDALEIGEWVLAVGNPFNLISTVTKGIVSGKARTLHKDKKDCLTIQSFIQTDAVLNIGNSGGALVNLRGELIGINTAILSLKEKTPSFMGYSFAIPVTLVKKVISDTMQ
ncbi:MAG: trypsin-like peptidase domain-containing protein [Amoebophilaceae bacterium]|nr:trypsin-like peptidase domain-containing protein [Amoebophilaceae bacterium]